MKRAAVIGCGALGTILVTNFARAEGWTLTGVMNEGARRGARRQRGLPRSNDA